MLACGTAYGISAKKYANSQKALELAARDGGVSSDELDQLAQDGGYAEFGEEIVDPNTGETVVLTQDENGNIVRTVVKDAQGNDTGAAIPEHHSEAQSGGSSSGGGHNHNWVARQASRQVDSGQTRYVVDVPAKNIIKTVCHQYCNNCHANVDNCGRCACGCGGSHDEYVDEVVGTTPEQGHYEKVYVTETYTIYVCSDCGVQQ